MQSSGEHSPLVAEHPSIAAAGFNAAGVRISWQTAAGPYALVIESEADLRACAAAAPTDYARHLAAAGKSRLSLERRFRLGGGLLALLLALPLMAIVLFVLGSDRVAGWAVQRIPTTAEVRLGELILAQTRLQMRLTEDGPAVAAIRDIGSRLTNGSVYRYRWLVAEQPEVNAFAAPGGVIVVCRGLLEASETPEELAGVLAHEVAHAELRHSLQGVVKSLGLRALVSMLAGDVSGSLFADAATRLTELRFSRAAEREADDEGLRRLVAARIDPSGMIRFYEKLAAEKRPSPPAILSTHPATGERLESLRLAVAGLRERWEPLGVDLKGAKRAGN